MNLPINLDRDSNIPLKHQLYDEIRRLILGGQWKPGYKLPSTRVISQQLDISRPIITWAFEQLLNEGYIQTFTGSGAYVSKDLPEELLHATKEDIGIGRDDAPTPALSDIGNYLHDQGELQDKLGNRLLGKSGRFKIDFRDTHPCLDEFPISQWKKLLVKHWDANFTMMNCLQDPAGHQPLRQAIAQYLFRARAISCKPEQVIIVGGAQQGLDLITKLHVNSGDQVALEDPGYPGAQHTFRSFGAQIWPIPVDEHGLDVDTLEAFGSVKFKLIYTTPTHQAPLGPSLSLARRLKLIHWAQKTGALIAEDDYDGGYRYAGRPIPALAAMDNGGCVLYIGSFSKVLFPSLRLGYLVVPERLIDTYRWAKKLEDNYTPILEQAVLADFMNSGSFDKYLRRMSKIYGSKRQRLVESLKDHFGETVEVLGESAGLSLTVRFKTDIEDKIIVDKLATLGVGINTTSRYYLADKYTKGEFFIAYSDLNEDKIDEGVKKIAQVIGLKSKSG